MTNWLLIFICSIGSIIIVWIISYIIIINYKLPIHRLIRYRILREHNTFDCVGKIHGYYKFYIQETYFIFWSNVSDNQIPTRRDGELYDNNQRQDNYFDTLENALKCKIDLIQKREFDYEVSKTKEKNKIFK